MNLNWNYLNTFIVLSETLSFSKTAQKLNSSQPVVTRQIQSLEHDLGYALFIRHQKKVVLSHEGLILKNKLTPLLDEMKVVLLQHSETDEQRQIELRIGSMFEAGQIVLFPVLNQIIKKNSQIKLNFNMNHSAQIFNDLKNGLIDFGFVYQPDDSKMFDYFKVYKEHAVLVAHKNTTVDKILDQEKINLIKYRKNESYTDEFIKRNLNKKFQSKFVTHHYMNSHKCMIEFIESHENTVAVMPYASAKEDIQKNRVQCLFEDKTTQDLFIAVSHLTLLDKNKKKILDLLIQGFKI